MEDIKKNHPSLPPNYVSLADLQQRWLKQQQEKREKEEAQQQEQKKRENEEAEKQKKREIEESLQQNENAQENAKPETQFQEPNPLHIPSKRNFKNQKPFYRRNYSRDRKGPKEYRLVQVSNPIPKASDNDSSVAIDGPDHPMGSGNELKSEKIGIDGPDQKVKDEKEMKKKKKKKKRREKMMKKVAQLEMEGSKIEDNVTIEIDGPDKKVNDKKTKKKNKNKNKKTTMATEKPNAVINKEEDCGEERENERKEGSEVQGTRNVGDQTVEIGRRFEGLAVKGRWTAVIDGAKRRDRDYGSILHRGVGIKKRENNGLVWVKKE